MQREDSFDTFRPFAGGGSKTYANGFWLVNILFVRFLIIALIIIIDILHKISL